MGICLFDSRAALPQSVPEDPGLHPPDRGTSQTRHDPWPSVRQGTGRSNRGPAADLIPFERVTEPEPSEPQLIERILDGDLAAFATLVQPCLRLFTSGIHRILQQEQATQQTLEEALLRIHAELPHHQDGGRFSIWAYRLCLSEALAARRARTRRAGAGLEDLRQPFPVKNSGWN